MSWSDSTAGARIEPPALKVHRSRPAASNACSRPPSSPTTTWPSRKATSAHAGCAERRRPQRPAHGCGDPGRSAGVTAPRRWNVALIGYLGIRSAGIVVVRVSATGSKASVALPPRPGRPTWSRSPPGTARRRAPAWRRASRCVRASARTRGSVRASRRRARAWPATPRARDRSPRPAAAARRPAGQRDREQQDEAHGVRTAGGRRSGRCAGS